MLAVKCEFASFPGCELHSIRYAGDSAGSAENLAWLNSLTEEGNYTEAVEFLMDFHSTGEEGSTLEKDTDYKDYQWWLARTEEDGWEIVSRGY